ncbi:hypothetical protein [Nocardia concava]|uniref:hypothetical protein n=1 Tax=Nocardia concava TaxID=257281 RepID=UPI0002E76CD6|nr:hypothetical protein [Nocardia concava]
MFRRSGIFADPPVELTTAQMGSAVRGAKRAARESRRSLRTAGGQYRRYRRSAGAIYLDWPRWRAEYLREYRGGSDWVGPDNPDGIGGAASLSSSGL